MTAQGTQLLLPDGLSASGAADALAAEIPIVTQRATNVERTFWDSFDGRLHAEGLALVSMRRRLALVDARSYAEQVAGEIAAAATVLRVRELAPGPLRDRLVPLLQMRAVTPIARVRSRLLPLSVLDDEAKTVVRLRVEEAEARGDGEGDARVALPARLHVAGVRGYDGELQRVLALLTGRLGLVEASRPLQDDAVAVAGGVPGGVSSKLRPRLRPDQRADAATVEVARGLLATLQANVPGTLADVDSEFLHDLRVAVRRTRALQRELRGVFPPAELPAFRDGFRELQRVTGATRDLDVQLLEFGELTDELPATIVTDTEPLRRLLDDRRVAERRRMVRALSSPRTRALLRDWPALLDGLGAADEADRPDAARPIADVAGARIARVYKRMTRIGAEIDATSPAAALHELRKKGKELRYLLEFFSSLYPPDVVKPMIRTLKALQHVLGRFQDREVQAAELRGLGEELATADGGAAALMAMGVLVERLHDDQARARAQFAERFEAFAAKDQRTLVKRTFT